MTHLCLMKSLLAAGKSSLTQTLPSTVPPASPLCSYPGAGTLSTHVKRHTYCPWCPYFKAIKIAKVTEFTHFQDFFMWVPKHPTPHGKGSARRHTHTEGFQSSSLLVGVRPLPPTAHQGSKDCSDCFRQCLQWARYVLLISSPWFRKLMAFIHAYSSLLTFNWLNLRKR